MKRLWLACAFAISLSVTSVAAQDVGTGVDAYTRGDYGAARAAWQPLAERGDRDAQANLGLLYARGQGVPQDYATALKWFQQSANQGYAIAQNNLGVMYRNGYGVRQDYEVAAMFYLLSAAQGYPLAQHSLGAMYENGEGIRPDYVEAYMWYTLAAEQGHDGAKRARQSLNVLISEEQKQQALARASERKAKTDIAAGSKLTPPSEVDQAQQVAAAAPQEKVSTAAPTTPLSSPAEVAAKIPDTPPVAPQAPPPEATAEVPDKAPTTQVTPPTEVAAIPPDRPTAKSARSTWRVQLISLRDEAQTDAVWAKLLQSHEEVLDGLERHVQQAKLANGTYYRIQVGPMASLTEANSLCDTLKSRGQDCLVVGP